MYATFILPMLDSNKFSFPLSDVTNSEHEIASILNVPDVPRIQMTMCKLLLVNYKLCLLVLF